MTTLPKLLTGTLMPDGSLHLDRKPELRPGRVEVQLHPIPSSSTTSTESWWDYLQSARRELETAGHAFRSREDIDNQIDSLRGEWDDEDRTTNER